MDAVIIIGGVLLSYLVFVLITFWVARMLFPKIEISDDDLIDVENIKKLKNQFFKKHRRSYVMK